MVSPSHPTAPGIAGTLPPPRRATATARLGRAADIRATLKEEIEAGLMFPGTALDEKLLAERFGVSRTPVREALQQLAAQDLVKIEPNIGAHVARLSVAEVRAMLEYLSEMEALCAKLAARRIDPDLCAAINAALEQGRLSVRRQGEGYRDSNDVFHEAIYAGCHSIYLAAQIRKTRRLLLRYRAHEHMSLERCRQSLADHEKIAAAILTGDEQGASHAMLSHLPTGTSGFSEFLAKVPMHFFDAGQAPNARN